MRQKLIVFFILISISLVNATQNKLVNDSYSDIIFDIVEDGDHLWIVTYKGLVKFNIETEVYSFFKNENLGLPGNMVKTIAIDSLNRVWIGTTKAGIGVLSKDSCTIYNSNNSDLPSNYINCIKNDSKGNMWIGSTIWLSKFDGTNWKIYQVGSPYSSNFHVTDVAFKENSDLWVGTRDGLYEICNDSIIWHKEKNIYLFFQNDDILWGFGYDLMTFDGNIWTQLDTSSSEMPTDSISYECIQSDSKGNIWIGTNIGLIKYNGINWIIYNKNNSELPINYIENIFIDKKDNIWIGRGFGFDPVGLLKFDGVNCKQYHFSYTGVEDDRIKIPTSFFLNQNYPNPFNSSTKIEFGFPKSQNVEINIFSLTGVKIKTLINTIMQAGYHTVNWNATNDNGNKVPSGYYFYQMKCDDKIFTKKMLYIK